MKILVTGACGYIGRHVVACLIKHGVEVIAVDVNKVSQMLGVKLYAGDILGDQAFVDGLPVPDVVLHLAWQDGFNHRAESHLRNLNAHLQFLLTMANRGAKRLAVMGSMHEVGYWEGAIDETTPCNPLSYYGIAKNTLRQSLMVALKGSTTQLQWLRGFYINGDDRANHSVFTKLLSAAEEGKRTFPFTSGKNLYDFTSVDSVADMITKAVMQDRVLGVINICSGKPISLAAAVEDFIKRNNLDISLDYGAFPDRPYDSPGIWGDPTKINQILRGV